MRSHRFDIHQHITDQIISMIELARGGFMLPWHVPAINLRPTNVASSKPYRGVNILALWAAAEQAGYASGLWGTYRQWIEAGAQVRRGEKASYIVFYKNDGKCPDADPGDAGEGDDDHRKPARWLARASAVFAAEQVDGFLAPERPMVDPVTAIDRAEAFVAGTGARIIHEGHRAYYRPSTDDIHLPPREAFVGSKSSSATETYYSTLFHELTHWTSHKVRCDRDLGRRFGKDAYAMEELIAELGAAFLCTELEVTGAPRPDHAQYLREWLAVLNSDKKAIFTAASQASRAVEFLRSLQSGATGPDDYVGDRSPEHCLAALDRTGETPALRPSVSRPEAAAC